MSNRHLHLKTPDQLALQAVEGVISLEQAAQLFMDYDRGQDPVSHLIPEAEVVERLAYAPPQNPNERLNLKPKFKRSFGIGWKI